VQVPAGHLAPGPTVKTREGDRQAADR
jgi:hypothetical protein